MKDDKKQESFKEIIERAKKECSSEDTLKTGLGGVGRDGVLRRGEFHVLTATAPFDKSRFSFESFEKRLKHLREKELTKEEINECKKYIEDLAFQSRILGNNDMCRPREQFEVNQHTRNLLMKAYGITETPSDKSHSHERRFGFSKEEGFGITKWSYVVPVLPEGSVIVTEELDPSDDNFVFVFVKEQNKPECEVYVCYRNTGVIVYHQSLNEMVVERGKSPSFLKWYYAMIEYKHKLFEQHFLSWGIN